MAETTNRVKNWYYINGISPGVAKQFAKFFFEDLYDRLEKIHETHEYHIYLTKPKDEEELKDVSDDIQYWVDYFGASYKFFWKAESEKV